MQTLLVNLYGAPCSGKSVKMMQLASHAKIHGHFAEISAEVAKEYVVQHIPITREVQIDLTREQTRRLKCFVGHTEITITDAPVLIGAFYAHYRKMENIEEIDALFQQFSREIAAQAHKVVNVYMWRDHPYDKAGRLESEHEDKNIADSMWAYVQHHCDGQPLIEARSTEPCEDIWLHILAAAK